MAQNRWEKMFRSKYFLVFVGVLVTALLIVGTQALAIGEDEIYRACVNNKSGTLRMVMDENDTCTNAEILIEWNKEGIQGPQGPPGPSGVGGGVTGRWVVTIDSDWGKMCGINQMPSKIYTIILVQDEYGNLSGTLDWGCNPPVGPLMSLMGQTDNNYIVFGNPGFYFYGTIENQDQMSGNLAVTTGGINIPGTWTAEWVLPPSYPNP